MQSSSHEQQADQAGRSARRRLIRGAFGAPAALTLYSGSAMAAGTLLNCVGKRVINPVNPGTTATADADGYVRVQVKFKGTGSAYSAWVSGADVLAAASLATGQSGYSFLGVNNWYCLAVGDGSTNTSGYTAGLIYTDAATIAGGTPAVLANNFVALRFNGSGQIVGVTTTAGASAVAASCWSSFRRTI